MTYPIAALLAAILVLVCIIILLIVSKNKQAAGASDVKMAETFSAAAARLLDLPEGEDIYKAIGEEVHKICGNSFVIVNSFERMYDQFIIKSISGVNSLIQKALQMLGSGYLNASFKLDDYAKAVLTNGQLKEVEGGLYRITFGKVPKEICEEVEQFFKMKKMYAMGFARKGELFGNVIIIPIFGNEFKNRKMVEAAINLASTALFKKIGKIDE